MANLGNNAGGYWDYVNGEWEWIPYSGQSTASGGNGGWGGNYRPPTPWANSGYDEGQGAAVQHPNVDPNAGPHKQSFLQVMNTEKKRRNQWQREQQLSPRPSSRKAYEQEAGVRMREWGKNKAGQWKEWWGARRAGGGMPPPTPASGSAPALTGWRRYTTPSDGGLSIRRQEPVGARRQTREVVQNW